MTAGPGTDRLLRLWRVITLFGRNRIVGNFSNMPRLFFSVPLASASRDPTPLPPDPRPLPATFEFAGRTHDIADWRAERRQTAMVVLRSGRIAFEDYRLGTSPEDTRISWSVAKSVFSAAFGIAVDEGLVPDLDVVVTDWLPELAGTAYETATIRNLLNMASGVAFDEDYLDFYSDINKMGRVLAMGGSMDGFARGLDEVARPAGTRRQYTSIDTHVLGMVLRRATGMSVPAWVNQRLLSRIGCEGDGYWLTDGRGVAFVLGGLNLRTRDYARFGLMMAQDGCINGAPIVSKEWVRASTVQSAPPPAAPSSLGYGLHWWLPPDPAEGEFLATGIYGQYVFVDRPRQVVIAVNAADRAFRGTDRDIHAMNIEMFRAIARALA